MALSWNVSGGIPGITSSRPGNSYLRSLHDYVMQNALAEQSGARNAAMRSAGEDPSMAAYGSLAGMLSGQSDASRQLSGARLQWMRDEAERNFQIRLMRLRAQMEKEAQGNPLWGSLGQLGGSVLGAWLSPGGWFRGEK